MLVGLLPWGPKGSDTTACLAKSLRGRPDCVVVDVDLAGRHRAAAPALHPCARSTETTRLIHWWWGH